MRTLPERIRGRFINPHAKALRRSLWDVLLWKMGLYNDVSNGALAPSDFTFPLPQKPLDNLGPKALWINHSSFLIEAFGRVFLTDPVWARRCSPFSFFGPKRRHAPGVFLEEIKQIDYVLISHNHYDHLDKDATVAIHKRHTSVTWIVPLGVKKWFLDLGITNVKELAWWEMVEVSCAKDPSIKMEITATPAQHFSGRSLRDYNKTLWCGFVVEIVKDREEKRFYFVGDTGYNPYDFKAIGQRWDGFDLSLIPIGCYSPKVFMSPVHIDPWEAVWIHKEARSKLSIGMHWNTFRLSDEGRCRPPYDLYLALKEASVDPCTFLAVPPGYVVNW